MTGQGNHTQHTHVN